jgi:enterobacterial common antigen flippase
MALTVATLSEIEIVGSKQEKHSNCKAEAALSYSQILRSSMLIGGSSAINMAIGVVRNKAIAVMLGPSGVGLMGAFNSIADLTRIVAALGVTSSGVRQIAEAVGSGNAARVATTAIVLRRVAIALGVVGALLLVCFAHPVAVLTFGNDEHAFPVGLLSLAVLFKLVADGQGALLQGLRRIADLAKVGIGSAVYGAVVSVAFVYWLRELGVALALVAAAAASLGVSWWYSRKIPIDLQPLSFAQVRSETAAMLRLGLAFMFSALLTMGAAYLVQLILIRHNGLSAAGQYQAAWTVGGIYVAFILQAMATDFYPRLVAVAHDDVQCNRLVNEQAQVSLLLAGAGVLGTLTFASWIVALLYSAEFKSAVEVLRWVCLGMAIRVVTWPLGYILIAKGQQKLFVSADLLWTIVNIGLTWVCVQRFGVAGAGLAFFGSYVVHLLVVYPMCRRLSGFRWSRVNVRIVLSFAAVIAAVQVGFLVLDDRAASAVGAVAFVASAVVSLRAMRRLVTPEQLSGPLSRLLYPRKQKP